MHVTTGPARIGNSECQRRAGCQHAAHAPEHARGARNGRSQPGARSHNAQSADQAKEPIDGEDQRTNGRKRRTCENAWNRRACFSGEMPMPVSRTANRSVTAPSATMHTHERHNE